MAHIHEKIDWTVGAYIVHEDRVLIRLHEKYKLWLAVGGHVELHEDPLEAIKRECLEEVGLEVTIHGEEHCKQWDDKIRDLPTPAAMNRHYISDTHEHIDIIYFATSEHRDVVPENEDDVWIWLTKDEVEEHPEIEAEVKHYAKKALDILGK